MRLRIRCSQVALALVPLLGMPAGADADSFSFVLKKSNDTWQCTGVSRANDQPVQVAVDVQGLSGGDDAVKLVAKVDLASGSPLGGSLVRSKVAGEEGIWRLTHTSKEAKATLVTITGTVEGKDIAPCSAKASGGGGAAPAPVSRVRVDALDFAAAEWLASHGWAFDLLRAEIAAENPKYPLSRIVFLPHLPSGAKAPSYPTSVSERDLAQVVMVVPDEEGSGDFAGAVDWSLTRCESIPLYRVYGSIEGLAAAQTSVRPKGERPFKLWRIGHTMSCGAEALGYTMVVTSSSGAVGDPVQTTVPVRPVYHLGATGTFGYDWSRQSTFVLRDGKIDEAEDRFGPGLLVGATYFVNGVDFGDMRWYNYFANPFVVVSLESPKDRFVVGTALTQRGGISLAVGVAFNHVNQLASGYTAGQAFSGQGDIPVDKVWRYGLYVGAAFDDKLFASFRKLTQGGTGGGSAQPGAEAEAKKKADEEAKKKAEAEAKKKEAAKEKN